MIPRKLRDWNNGSRFLQLKTETVAATYRNKVNVRISGYEAAELLGRAGR